MTRLAAGKILRGWPGIIGLALAGIVITVAPCAARPLRVEWKEGRLSVIAERAPLSQVLQEVARRTGLEVRGIERARDEVSVRFTGLSLREGLKRLLANLDYVIFEEASSGGASSPVVAQILGSGTAPTPLTTPARARAVLEVGPAAVEAEIEGEEGTKPEDEPAPEVMIDEEPATE